MKFKAENYSVSIPNLLERKTNDEKWSIPRYTHSRTVEQTQHDQHSISAFPIHMSYSQYSSLAAKISFICSLVNMYGVKSTFGCFDSLEMKFPVAWHHYHQLWPYTMFLTINTTCARHLQTSSSAIWRSLSLWTFAKSLNFFRIHFIRCALMPTDIFIIISHFMYDASMHLFLKNSPI